jgi:4-alpha-glucanotransferase
MEPNSNASQRTAPPSNGQGLRRNEFPVQAVPLDFRGSGILLHVTSLPSPYGIGDFGPAAVSWIDQLVHAGQSWWQTLPLGPTGYDNSPYQPLSSFAGDDLLISPDWLVEDELLATSDLVHDPLPAAAVDYDACIPFKQRLLEKAWGNFKAGARPDLRPPFEQFRRDQNHWLDDYALFRVLKAKFGDAHYLAWPAEFVHRKPDALAKARTELADEMGRVSFAQFLVFRHADRLKKYANGKGLKIIGDLPFFVSEDSSDVWANPELFLLDEKLQPRFVAGVPPDYFSADGQLWGNPVYDWDSIHQSGYRWWIARLRSLLSHDDLIRLDHFRGFVAAWHVPAGATSARAGQWLPGPGADLLQAVKRELGRLPFVAEDLGIITADVYALRDQFGLPGMRVLQFAFDGHSDNPHLPENFVVNTVAYTGTHDNPTTRGWFEDLHADQQENVGKFLKQRGAKSSEAAHGLIEVLWSSVAALAITPLQDLLNLGKEARMNVPGLAEGNWRWRCTAEMLSDPAFEWLGNLTKDTRRSKPLTREELANAGGRSEKPKGAPVAFET